MAVLNTVLAWWPIFATVVTVASGALHFVPTTGAWVYLRKAVAIASLAEGALKGNSKPTVADAVEALAATVETETANAVATSAEAKVVSDFS